MVADKPKRNERRARRVLQGTLRQTYCGVHPTRRKIRGVRGDDVTHTPAPFHSEKLFECQSSDLISHIGHLHEQSARDDEKKGVRERGTNWT